MTNSVSAKHFVFYAATAIKTAVDTETDSRCWIRLLWQRTNWQLGVRRGREVVVVVAAGGKHGGNERKYLSGFPSLIKGPWHRNDYRTLVNQWTS